MNFILCIIALFIVFIIVCLCMQDKAFHFVGFIGLAIITSVVAYYGTVDAKTEAIRDYLNGNIEVDTVAMSPKGKILDVKLKYK